MRVWYRADVHSILPDMLRCSTHNVVLVRRREPFSHFACPVPGCEKKKADKWAPRIQKRELGNKPRVALYTVIRTDGEWAKVEASGLPLPQAIRLRRRLQKFSRNQGSADILWCILEGSERHKRLATCES